MFKFLRRHRTFVMTAMAVTIALLIIFGIGGSSFMTSPFDTIIKINGHKVSQVEFDRVFNQIARSHPDAATQRQQVMSQTLNEIIRQEVFYQESKKFGIDVSDQQLQLQLQSYPAFQKDGKFDLQTYARMVGQVMGMSPRDFEKNQKKDIAGRNLNQLVAESVQITDQAVAEEMNAQMAAEKDAAKRKEIAANPEKIREDLKNKEMNLVFNDWLTQLNTALKVNIVSDAFRQRLGSPQQ